MAKSKYFYLLYDKNKNPHKINPDDFGILDYVRNVLGKSKKNDVELDTNDAIHLFNAQFTSNRELMDDIISEYNAYNPNKRLNHHDFCYAKLVTKKYENFYGLPAITDISVSSDDKPDENSIKREHLVVPIIYKNDILTDNDKKAGRTFELDRLLVPNNHTLFLYLDASDSYIEETYKGDLAAQSFYKNLRDELRVILKKRYENTLKNVGNTEFLPPRSTLEMLTDEIFWKREMGYDDKTGKYKGPSAFIRIITDLIVFYEKLFSICRNKGKSYIISKVPVKPSTMQKLLTFSKSDLQNYSEISKNFPVDRRFPTEKEITSNDTADEIEHEIREQEALNRINNQLGTNYVLSDLKDTTIEEFVDTYFPVSNDELDEENENPIEVSPQEFGNALKELKRTSNLEDVARFEREQQELINKVNSEFEENYTASDLENHEISDFIDTYSDNSKNRS